MLIGVRKRFVFVANSKTASTAIEQALINHAEIHRGGAPQRKHIAMAEALKEYHFLFGQPRFAPDSFFRFGVLRDPVDWITSWFRYRRGNKVDRPLPREMSFAEFWRRGDWNRFRADGSPRLQGRAFTDADGRPIVDCILPHEALDRMFPQICQGLGLDVQLRPRNVSEIPPESEGVPPELMDEVRAFYAADYALRAQLPALNAAGLEKLAARR